MRAVCITAPTGPVRGLVCARPWTERTPKTGTHRRIADGGGPANAPRMAYALVTGGRLGRSERAVIPSAQPCGFVGATRWQRDRYSVRLAATRTHGQKRLETVSRAWHCHAEGIGLCLRSLSFSKMVSIAVARRNKIKVSVRLSVKTVPARAYYQLVSARVGSCFSRSARFTCGDGT
jgi:hypothetical protein